MCTWKELNWLRISDVIKTYDDLCYYKWGKTGCYNLLDESKILKPSDSEDPKIDKMIKLLIENVCWYKEENIEYLHKALLYKYHNLNDFTVPAIVFYWAWWSWKWSFITLLSTIFWEQNVMANLWQRDISWSFDTYKWCKLVVEFAEITTNNNASNAKILNKLKNIIWAQKMVVNEKWIQPYEIDNIAWFFISSNSNKPLKLDDRNKWNRRFTVIKSLSKLKDWHGVNAAITNSHKVASYLARLYKTILRF